MDSSSYPGSSLIMLNNQRTIYSATTFLESSRKVVQEKWFEKSGSRNLVREKWLTRKKGGFILKTNQLFSGSRKVVDQKKNRFCRTTFLAPLFYTFLQTWLQNKWSLVSFKKLHGLVDK